MARAPDFMGIERDTRQMDVRSESTFYKGVKDGLPIAFGYLSVAFAFGMLAVEKGFAVWAPVLISLTSFTGTGQFVGIDLMAAGAAFAEVAFTILIVNLRYLLMSLSLSQKIAPEMKLWQRIIVAFGNTDEIFAVSMQQRGMLNFRYILGLILSAYSGWVAGTAVGALASGILPMSVRSALGIAIYAMFVAIIVPAAKTSKPVMRVALIAVLLSCLFAWVPGLKSLSSGWVIIICGVVASALGAYFYPIYKERDVS